MTVVTKCRTALTTLSSLLRRSSRCVSRTNLVLAFLIGVGAIAFSAWSMLHISQHAVTQAESSANFRVAFRFADRLRVFSEEAPSETVAAKLQDLASMNPSVRLYIVDEHGILKHSPKSYGRVILPFVDVKPISAALENTDHPNVILGDDPHQITEPKPISVATLRLGGGTFYLYVVLSPASLLSQSFSLFGFQWTLLSASIITLAVAILAGVLLRGAHRYHTLVNSSLAAISHDLRGPLTAIQGYLETIIEKDSRLSPQDKEKYLSVALRSTRSATGLVNDLHQISKIEAQDQTVSMDPISVADLVMEALLAAQPSFDQKALTVDCEIPPCLPIGYGNAQLLERLFRNILENAIRYTPARGRIQVVISASKSDIRCTITDSGIGIPQSELDKVKSSFFRGAQATSHASGSGLGLSIADQIARLHGGELKILSKEREGTAVVFSIPLCPLHPHSDRAMGGHRR